MPTRVVKFKKSTRRHGRKASRKTSRKAVRKMRHRRQRGGGELNIYAKLDGTAVSNLSSDAPNLAAAAPLTAGASMITAKFSSPITFTGATWSKWDGAAWAPVGTYLTNAAASSYTFAAMVGAASKVMKAPRTIPPFGATEMALPATGVSTSTVVVNNITSTISGFGGSATIPTTKSPVNNTDVNLKITFRTSP